MASVESEAVPGSKGDPITIGALLLTLMTSGGLVALIGVIKAYVERDASLELDFKREDGARLTLRAENLGKKQIEETMKIANNFFGMEE